jgi:hypothetical protein
MDGPKTPVRLQVTRSPWQAHDAPTRRAVVMRVVLQDDVVHARKLSEAVEPVNHREGAHTASGLHFDFRGR